MTLEFTPREYQAQSIAHIVDTPRCALWLPMGGGKTVSVLTALEHLSLVDDVYPCLIIAPRRVADTTWPDEVQKWAHLEHVRVSRVLGTAAERSAALNVQAELYTVNYENLPWLVEHLDGAWPFKTVVADESTKLKGFRLRQGSVRAKALAKYARRTPRFIELTGTPSPNGLADLWGQLWFLDQGERLGTSFSAFESRWFYAKKTGANMHAVQQIPFPKAREEIEDRLGDICLSIDVAKYIDLREPVVSSVFVDLPEKARKLYKDMEKEMFISLSTGEEVEAFGAAAKTMKCLQLANGAIYTSEDGDFQEVHNAKIEALESIVEEAGGAPVLVAYHFKSDLARLLKAFPKSRHLDDNPNTIRDWNKGRIPVLFAHPASAGHGLNLQDGGNIIAFFGHNWNLEEYQQIIERIGPTRQAQAGYDRPVFIYHIIAKGTVDEVVMARRESKREVQDLLMEAMRRNAT